MHQTKILFLLSIVILDACEMRTEIPSRVDHSVYAFSSYKHGHTIKFLIGIAPNGLITFISKGYGGRTKGKLFSRAFFESLTFLFLYKTYGVGAK